MAGNLFDQLKKAGLVNEHKAKQAKKEKYQQTKQNKGKKGAVAVNEAAELAAAAAQQKAERDRQLNLERQQIQAEKAAQVELRQLIDSNRLQNYGGDKIFNFADDKVVKTLEVNAKTRQGLVEGEIRIVRFAEGYVLVSDTVAEKIAKRDASVLIPFAKEDDGLSDEDRDYYAKFAIPDDLVW